jgi:SAM-dependent methyltransferase
MASESRVRTEVKPASKTRLIRYAIDRFLLQVSQSMAPGILLLDSGAGSCKHRNFFPQAHILSFDNRQSRQRRYGEIDLVGDLYAIPFREDTFDAALNIEVLEHLREPKRALGEIYRVLRPGGKLFLVAPQAYQEHQIPHDYFRFTSFGLRYLLEGAGFKIVTIDPLGGYFWCLGHLISESYRYFFPTIEKRSGRCWILHFVRRHSFFSGKYAPLYVFTWIVWIHNVHIPLITLASASKCPAS